MHRAAVVERRRLDLGAAEVDADPKHRHAWTWSLPDGGVCAGFGNTGHPPRFPGKSYQLLNPSH
jgi:hypothetical protein